MCWSTQGTRHRVRPQGSWRVAFFLGIKVTKNAAGKTATCHLCLSQGKYAKDLLKELIWLRASLLTPHCQLRRSYQRTRVLSLDMLTRQAIAVW
jgi:hypothetical protein